MKKEKLYLITDQKNLIRKLISSRENVVNKKLFFNTYLDPPRAILMLFRFVRFN